MRVTMSLQSQRSNLWWKIFYCQFSRISENKLKTDFNVILSCEPDDGSYWNVIFSCEPGILMNPLTARLLGPVDAGSDTWRLYSFQEGGLFMFF